MARRVPMLCLTGLIAAGLSLPGAAQSPAPAATFQTAATGAPREAFLRGLRLLEALDYQGAREAFREAQATPGFVMAHWGEALTHRDLLEGRIDTEAGRAALARLAPTPEARLALTTTDRERDWLRAVEALFGDGDEPARARLHASRMQGLADRNPDDLDARVMTAFAWLGVSAPTRDTTLAMRAAALGEDVLRADANHAGALRVLLHAYDDAAHAPLARRHAEAYLPVAPPAAGAELVPARAFLALGQWARASESAEKARKSGAAGSVDADRAALWLLYSYLQQGRYADAKAILDQLDAPGPESRPVAAFARAAWLVETRRWTDARPIIAAGQWPADATAAELFAAGMAAFRTGNRPGGNDALQRMAALVGDGDRPLRSVTTARPTAPARPGVNRPGVTPIPTSRPSLPGPPGAGAANEPATTAPPSLMGVDRRLASVMAQQLEAVLIFSEGRRDEAIVLARQAAVVAEELPPAAGPPVPVKPGFELVGDLLMDVRRPAEAITAYETSLRAFPGRALSLYGLYRAATLVKNGEKAQQALVELRRVLERADKSIPELREIFGNPPS
ncbi:MAG: hypothetical protein IT178_10665 [Acidobacteria bacterium]|nr:hypothetical protein [Acidobacteriota bacterium]